MFQHVEPFGGDPILSLNEDFQRDPRPNKINLSIGIYFDDEGRIPVLDSVKRAEAKLLAADGPKPYLPMEGAANFRSAAQVLLFGAQHEDRSRVCTPISWMIVSATWLALWIRLTIGSRICPLV